MVAVLLVADLLIEFAESVEEWSKQKSRVFDHASLYGLVRQLGLCEATNIIFPIDDINLVPSHFVYYTHIHVHVHIHVCAHT